VLRIIFGGEVFGVKDFPNTEVRTLKVAQAPSFHKRIRLSWPKSLVSTESKLGGSLQISGKI
jgi:hypothetical protein